MDPDNSVTEKTVTLSVADGMDYFDFPEHLISFTCRWI